MKQVIAAVAIFGLAAIPAPGQESRVDTAVQPQQEEPPDDYWLGPGDSGGSASTTPVHFDIGVRAVSLQEVNASDSYDAVYEGDAMTQIGVQLELQIRRHYLIALAYETGEVDGHKVIVPPTGPIIRTQQGVTLTLSPLHLTGAWVFAPDSSWHGFAGIGPTLLDWEEEETGAGGQPCPADQDCDGSDIGYHAVGGLRWSTAGRRFTVGGELRYSSIPDTVGEHGVTRRLDEDDLGGTTIGLSLLWRVR